MTSSGRRSKTNAARGSIFARNGVAVAAGLIVAIAAACGAGDAANPLNGGKPTNPSEQDSSVDVADGALDVTTGGDAYVDAGPQPAPFGLDARPSNKTCVAPPRPVVSGTVAFERVFEKVTFTYPMMLVQTPNDSAHWYAALRAGDIIRFDANNPQTSSVVGNVAALSGFQLAFTGEGGLLGMAPHPNFAQNGRLYVSWNSLDVPAGYFARSRVGYLTSTDGGQTFTSYTNLLYFDQTLSNHYGGGIAFGRDGYLYFSFGEGGDATRAQNTNGFFSKVLRVDPDNVPVGSTYGIPSDNPFKLGGGEPATYAYGFRNPFRFSFDRATGDLWVGDVGQSTWEEVDRVERGGNYGWPCREGKHNWTGPNPTYCPNGLGNTIDPIIEHEHVIGVSPSRSITGGVVYRGKNIPSFIGSYIYGDFVTHELFALTFDPATGLPSTSLINGGPTGSWVHFAEGNDGEVLLVDLYGFIYKMVPGVTAPPSTFPAKLSETGCVEPTDPKKAASGVLPYDINAPFWSDGAAKTRFLALPDGAKITVGADGDFDLPNGSVLMKTFFLGNKRIETRLFMRHDDGVWAGYSYAWLDDESDAVLLPASMRKKLGAQDWYFPSRADCLRCHTERAGRSLGLELGQLNRDLVYPTTNRISNQLATFEHIGLLVDSLPATLPRIPPPDGADLLELRARAYLHSNCSAPLAGDIGVVGAQILTPGSPEKSLLSLRPHSTGASRMPPIASSVVDTAGLAVVDDWIKALAACPP